jgi:OmpA-OmpF porin, OOP family
MNRLSILAVLLAGSLLTVGCATKNYVRNQTAPVINNVNELDDQTAKNTRDIRDTDTRAQQGIAQVNSKAADRRPEGAGRRTDSRSGQPECD